MSGVCRCGNREQASIFGNIVLPTGNRLLPYGNGRPVGVRRSGRNDRAVLFDADGVRATRNLTGRPTYARQS